VRTERVILQILKSSRLRYVNSFSAETGGATTTSKKIQNLEEQSLTRARYGRESAARQWTI
jgi:hypothetical protein